jgi:hypothetical protein
LIPFNIDEGSSNSLFSNIFNFLFDSIIENDRFNEAVQNSLNTFNDELFNKKSEYKFDHLNSTKITTDKKCFICLEINHDDLYELPCKHIFHYDCINEAVLHQFYKCPLCNAEIPKKKMQQEVNENGHIISYH